MLIVVGLPLLYVSLSDFSRLKNLESDFNERVSLVYQYSDGTQMRVEGDRPGPLIDIDAMPAHVINAVLAAEDHKFYSHGGVSWGSVFRAFFNNMSSGEITSGASTITMQLVKNTYGDTERGYRRKAKEIVVAMEAENYFAETYGERAGKDRILALYMSRIELGFANEIAVEGFEDAALRYYGKSARDLTLGEAALIAGMLNNWARLNPRKNYLKAQERRDLVLERMERFGFITAAQRDAGLEEVNVPIDDDDRSYLYTMDEIRGDVVALANERESGEDLQIRTSIDADLQRLAAKVLADELRGFREVRGAMVIASGDGRIRAMVGGRDYGLQQSNQITDSNVDFASLLKPFVFLEALSQGAEPTNRCVNLALPEEADWNLKNSRGYSNEIDLEDALATSSNIVPVRLIEELGRSRVVGQLQRFGLTSSNIPEGRAWLISASGSPMQMLRAYLPLANGGRIVEPTLIDSIATVGGDEVQGRDNEAEPLGYNEATRETLRSMLRSVVTKGTGRTAGDLAGMSIAGKTGTAEDNKSAWFVGFGDGWVGVVWVGHAGNGSGPNAVSGSNLPSRIFGRIVSQAENEWLRPGQFRQLTRLQSVSETGSERESLDSFEEKSDAFFVTGRAQEGFGCTG